MTERSTMLGEALADKIRSDAAGASSRPPLNRLARLVTGLCLALAGYVPAHWYWTLSGVARAPAGDPVAAHIDSGPRPSATERAETIAAAAPFGRAPDTTASGLPSSLAGIRLKGVMGRRGPQPGGAIFNTGSVDEYVALGADIAPGAVLAEVHATHVLVRRAGQLERIDIDEAVSRSATPGLLPQGRPGAIPGANPGMAPMPPQAPVMPNATLTGQIPPQGLPPPQPGAPTGPPPSRVILPGR